MKRITFLLILFTLLFATYNFARADFYYSGTPQYNPYNGYTVMSLPPPPPMSEVPFYVRDDYDDYLEDYYECILGYEHRGMVCRYWRKYAEKHGFYQKGAPVQQQNNAVAPAPAPQQPLPNTQQVPAQQPQAPAVTNQYNQMVPYTPAH